MDQSRETYWYLALMNLAIANFKRHAYRAVRYSPSNVTLCPVAVILLMARCNDGPAASTVIKNL